MRSRKNGTVVTRYFLGGVAAVVLAASFHDGAAYAAGVEDSGVRRISLKVTNPECKAITPTEAASANPNPSDLNDGNLDDAEIAALDDGCDLRAIALDKFGRRVPDVKLYLIRAEAGSSNYQTFGRPRTTNSRGVATWGFSLGAETDFTYRVRIQSGEVKSNRIELQLCTGMDTVDMFPNQADAGAGCP